jgi:tetratricopeptide (TPR) repeat protein
MTDVFVVQDEITARIATAVDPAIRQVEGQIAIKKHPSDLRSWDHLLRGLWHVNQFKKSSNAEARREFERATALDPKYALAHAWIALTHVFEAWFNWTDEHSKHLAAAHLSAMEAVRLDEGEPMAHVAAAFAAFWTARIDQARIAGLRALSLNGNSFMASLVCGGALNYSGECAEAVPHHLKALDLSPNDPIAWNCLGSLAHTYLNLRQFDDAVRCADRALSLRHGYLFARVVKVSALGHARRLQEGRQALNALFGVAPGFTVARMDHYPFVLAAQRQHLIYGLAAAGFSTSPAAAPIAGPPTG